MKNHGLSIEIGVVLFITLCLVLQAIGPGFLKNISPVFLMVGCGIVVGFVGILGWWIMAGLGNMAQETKREMDRDGTTQMAKDLAQSAKNKAEKATQKLKPSKKKKEEPKKPSVEDRLEHDFWKARRQRRK